MIAFGDDFPELQLPVPSDSYGRDYLGLSDQKVFTPSQVDGDLLMVELLNVHCAHCQMQAPAYNELFKSLERDAQMRGRVKILGIAIGNVPEEVDRFRRGFQIPFPVIADPGFVSYHALGATATPFCITIRQDRPGRPGVVTETHLGLNTDYLSILETLRETLGTDLAVLRARGKEAVRTRAAITPLYSDREIETRVRLAFIETGGRLVYFSRLSLKSGRRVYMADILRGEQVVRLFAEVTSRHSVCDICHDVHFIYLFDRTTRIVGFEPLQITKYGNVLWNEDEEERMRQRVMGQYLTAPRPFDPKLDAVSSATISSAIIFDSLARGESLLQELQEKGYME